METLIDYIPKKCFYGSHKPDQDDLVEYVVRFKGSPRNKFYLVCESCVFKIIQSLISDTPVTIRSLSFQERSSRDGRQ